MIPVLGIGSSPGYGRVPAVNFSGRSRDNGEITIRVARVSNITDDNRDSNALSPHMLSQPNTDLIDERAVVLASPRRQLVLQYIYESDGAITLDALSRKIAAAESDFETRSVDADAVRRVYDTLYMTHVPVLIERGVVEYNYEEGMLRATDTLEDFVQQSDDSRDEQRRWFLYYMIPAVALTGVVLTLNFEIVRNPTPVLRGVTLVGALLLLVFSVLKHLDTQTHTLRK